VVLVIFLLIGSVFIATMITLTPCQYVLNILSLSGKKIILMRKKISGYVSVYEVIFLIQLQ